MAIVNELRCSPTLLAPTHCNRRSMRVRSGLPTGAPLAVGRQTQGLMRPSGTDYLLGGRRVVRVSPSNPTATRNMVAGSGTGCVTVSVPVTSHGPRPAPNEGCLTTSQGERPV